MLCASTLMHRLKGIGEAEVIYVMATAMAPMRKPCAPRMGILLELGVREANERKKKGAEGNRCRKPR